MGQIPNGPALQQLHALWGNEGRTWVLQGRSKWDRVQETKEHLPDKMGYFPNLLKRNPTSEAL